MAILFTCELSFAQRYEGTLTGTITGLYNKTPVEYAAVSLFKMDDSSLVTGSITDNKGQFRLQAPFGRYFIKIEFISYKPTLINDIDLTTKTPLVNLKTISIAPSVQSLAEVEVTGDKSQVEMGLDKKIFNVEKDLSNIGGNASDVLENVPSVIVDMEGKVSLRGNENVRILIDGKPSGLMGLNPAKALEQIPANTIESIELITNPSAKYDAEGMAGIINIILKKHKQEGLNGLFSLTSGYPQNHNVSLNFNYGMHKFNFFGNYGLSFREMPGSVKHHRETTANDTTTVLDQEGEFTGSGLSYDMRLGADYRINAFNSLTLSGHYAPSSNNNPRNTTYKVYDYAQNLKDLYERNTDEKENAGSMDYDLGFQKNFKKKQQAFTANVRYSSGVSESAMDIVEIYELLNYAPDYSTGLLQKSSDKQSQSNFIVSADYTHPFGENTKMETGYKTEIRKTDLDYEVQEFNDSSDVWYNLINVSNRFIYEESVHAGYVTYSNKIKRFSYQAGLRAEQTRIASNLKETNEVYRKNYLNFFPSIHLSQELAKENKIQLSYTKRIKRPRDRDINPFNSYADALNLWVGNPDLNPELTHSYEIGHLKYWESAVLGSSVYYRHTDSVIQRIRRIDTNGVSIATPENFSTQDEFGVELTFSKDLFKWWKINGSLNYFRSIVDGGNLGNYSSDAYSYTGKINSTAVFWKDIQLQVMLNYRAPQETTQGMRKEMYFMDVGLKKDLLSKRASLMLKLGDVFNSKRHRMEFYGENFVINTEYRRSTRSIVLSFTYKINSYKPKERTKREGEYEMDDVGM